MPDIIYVRPLRTRKYVSIYKHQRHATGNWAKWVNVQTERTLFDYGDHGNFELTVPQNTVDVDSLAWLDDNGNIWSFQSDYSVIGTQKEQFGYFENPKNVVNPWHGFPVIPFSKSRYNISKSLLERWVNEGYLDQDDIPAILNKKRI